MKNPTNRDAEHPEIKVEYFDLLDRVKARRTAVHFETMAVSQTYADPVAVEGPKPSPKKPLLP
jgi:hypothetical protein